VHEAGARIEPKPEEADRARRRLERNGIVVRHGDVEGGPIHVLRLRGPFNRTVVLRTAIRGAQDQWLAKPVAQCLQLVQRGLVDQQLVGAPAGDLGGREVWPAPDAVRHVAEMVVEGAG
jgi:hypothetical protein